MTSILAQRGNMPARMAAMLIRMNPPLYKSTAENPRTIPKGETDSNNGPVAPNNSGE